MMAQFEAGDNENAYQMLARLEAEGDPNLVKLKCAEHIDAERGKPRMEEALRRIPGFSLR
jgi:hypothetical protein